MCANVGPGKRPILPGHSGIELGLIRLYRATKNPKYLKLADYIVKKHYTDGDSYCSGNRKTPAMSRTTAVGHAVAMMYLYAGAADLAQLTNDKEIMDRVNYKWNDVFLKTYITGGTGTRSNGQMKEGFGGTPYALPNQPGGAYCETCGSIALCLWNYRMFLATGDAKYINGLERTLYNAFLSGYSIEGNKFFYDNPLQSDHRYAQHAKRFEWHGCACCPTNVVRFVPIVPTFMYATNAKTGDVYVNLFARSETKLSVKDRKLTLTQETKYPYDGKVVIKCEVDDKPGQALLVRVPSWAKTITWTFNGRAVTPMMQKGYAVFQLDKKGGEIVCDIGMPVERFAAHPNVSFDRNRVTLTRGPIVYCFEQADGTNPFGFTLAKKQTFQVKPKQILPGFTVPSIVAQATDGKDVVAIPYFARAYRGPSPMNTWVPQADFPSFAVPDLTWEGKLYQPLVP